MSSTLSTGLLTAEQFAEINDGVLSELVRGKIVEMNVPKFRHGEVCSNFAFLLQSIVRPGKLGRVLTNDSGILTERDPDTVRGADVAFFSYARVPAEKPIDGYAEVAPELIAEVLSPSDRWSATHQKVSEYPAMGVDTVLVIDPQEERVHVFHGDQAGSVLKSGESLPLRGHLDGHSIDVSAIFE